MVTYWKNTILAIWDKVSADVKKEFHRELVNNKTFLNSHIKSFVDEATNLHDKEIPKQVLIVLVWQ